jgi:hypothetical protein
VFLLGESLFRLRMIRAANAKRLAVVAVFVLLAPIGSHISALALSATVASLLVALALWELRTSAHQGLGIRLGSSTDAPGAVLGDPRHVQPQPEGTP